MMRDRGQQRGIFLSRCSLVVRCLAKKTEYKFTNRYINNCKSLMVIKGVPRNLNGKGGRNLKPNQQGRI